MPFNWWAWESEEEQGQRAAEEFEEKAAKLRPIPEDWWEPGLVTAPPPDFALPPTPYEPGLTIPFSEPTPPPELAPIPYEPGLTVPFGEPLPEPEPLEAPRRTLSFLDMLAAPGTIAKAILGREPLPEPAHPVSLAEAGLGLISGEQFFKNIGSEAISGLPSPARAALDVLAAPSTLLTVGAGPEIGAALRGGPLLARLAAPLVEPIVSGPFAKRLAAETAVGTAGLLGAEETAERVPEEWPTPARVGLPLLAGLGAGLGAVGGIRGAERALPGMLEAGERWRPEVMRLLMEEGGGGRLPLGPEEARLRLTDDVPGLDALRRSEQALQKAEAERALKGQYPTPKQIREQVRLDAQRELREVIEGDTPINDQMDRLVRELDVIRQEIDERDALAEARGAAVRAPKFGTPERAEWEAQRQGRRRQALRTTNQYRTDLSLEDLRARAIVFKEFVDNMKIEEGPRRIGPLAKAPALEPPPPLPTTSEEIPVNWQFAKKPPGVAPAPIAPAAPVRPAEGVPPPPGAAPPPPGAPPPGAAPPPPGPGLPPEGPGQLERGFTERLRTTEGLVTPEVRQRLDETIETYEQLGNRVATTEAAGRIAHDPAAARARVLDLGHPADPVSISEGIQLFKQAAQAGNVDEADTLIRALAKKGTARGQEIQMFSVIDKMSPEGVFLEAHRTIQKYIAAQGEKGIPRVERRLAEAERLARAPGIRQEAAALREQAAKGGQRARDLQYLIDDTVREVQAQLTPAERQAIIKAKAILKQSGAEMTPEAANSFLDKAAALTELSGAARVRGIMDLAEEVRRLPEVIASQAQGRVLRPAPTLLAQQAADLTQLIDRSARNVFQQLNSADRLAVASVKATLKRADVELPASMAEDFLVRARELRELPLAEQPVRLKQLVAEIRSYDPVAKELARAKAIADAEARARAAARQYANDLAALIDTGARKAPGAVSSAERVAIGQAKAVLRKFGAELPEDMARDFLARARALGELAPEAQAGARIALVNEIKGFNPVQIARAAREAAQEQARLLRKRADDLEILTGRKGPVAAKRTTSYERQAIGQARQEVVKEGLALPEALANNLLDRAREVQGIAPGQQQARRYEALMQDIKNLVPPSDWQIVMDVLNIPRAIRSMWDISYMLRQGWRTAMTHPDVWAKAWKPMTQGMRDPAVAGQIQDTLATRPTANIAYWSGLHFLEFGAPLAKGEEFFGNRLLGAMPGFQASERGFVIPGNDMRAGMFDNIVKNWFPAGTDLSQIKSFEEAATLSGRSAKEFQDLARVFNVLTARGSVEWLRTNSTLLAPLFWSMRLAVSQVEPYYMLAAGPFGRGVTTPVARKELARLIVSQWGGFAATAALGTLAGVWETDPDPRAAHFGQVRFRGTNTWFDLTGGAGPYVRFLARVSTGTTKTASGEIVPIDRSDETGRFLSSKFAPIPSVIRDFAEGVNYIGARRDIVNPSHLLLGLRDLFAPLAATDIMEAFLEDGLRGGLLTSSQIVGLGAQTYRTLIDVRDQATQAVNFVFPTGPKAGQKIEQYQDLNEGQRKAVDETQAVQAQLASTEAQRIEPRAREQLQVLMPQYKRRLAELESNPDPNNPGLRQRIDAGLAGKGLKDAIQDLKQNRFQASQALLGDPNIKTYLERNIGKQSIEDALAEQYWSAKVPEDLATGNLNFAARDAERAQILAEADRLGVRRDYIMGVGENTYRGKRFADPVVRAKVEEYEADQEKMRPYFELAEDFWADALKEQPGLREWGATYSEYKASIAQLAQQFSQESIRQGGPDVSEADILRVRPQLARVERAIKAGKELYRKRNPRVNGVGLEDLLYKWGRVETLKSREKVGAR